MPTGEAQPVQIMPASISVPTANGLFIQVSVQSDGTADGATVATALQEIIDLFQAWPGRHPDADVTGQLYSTELAMVTPTNPIPLPDPPDPEI